MKITPMAGSGLPGQALGNATTERVSPDRIEAAKAIARGESPMRLTPSDTPVDPQVEKIRQNVRSLKMRTQVSPDRPIETLEMSQEPLALAPTGQSAIPGTTETPVAEETKPLSPQFAALAKQRRALQQERANLDREKAEIAKAATEGAGVDLNRLKTDPLSVLLEAGVTYDQLTEAIMSGGSNPNASEIKALKAEIEALRSGFDQKLSERDTQAETQVVSEIKREAIALVNEGDEFKYTRAMRKGADAARLVHEHWKETGEVWDVTHALKLIEAECKKDYDALTSALTPAQEAALQQQQAKPQGMRTLTNRDTATPPASRRDRMLAAFNGLKK